MSPSFSMRGLLALTALGSLALAEKAEPLAQRDAMLSPRQSTCRTPGWIPVCPGAFPCIPPGGVCCDDGITYVMPPETCPDGTSPIATAVTSGAAVPSITAAPPVPTTLTLPPVTEYEWYTWTIRVTWYYYYYTYFAFSASLTSSETRYTTTISLTASNSAAATEAVSSIAASITSSVKAQTATPTLGSVPPSTYTPPSTMSPSKTAPTTMVYPTGNTTVPVPPVLPPTGAPTEFTGAAARVGAVTGAFFGSSAVVAGVVGMVVPGVLMVWL